MLLDTLLRPNGDIDIDNCQSRIRWVKDTKKRVHHLVLGAAPKAGGQWSENPVATNLAIRTLRYYTKTLSIMSVNTNSKRSYADMLSLPGYTFSDHYQKLYGKDMPAFTRPSRQDVSTYYAQYPEEAGISSSIGLGSYVYQVERASDLGFIVRVLQCTEESGQQGPPISYTIRCRHVVLASGLFTRVLPPPPHLQQIPGYCPSEAFENNYNQPLLVIGSGFTAADILLSAHPKQKIIHIFKWDRTGSSPLKACHPSEYPEYAGIYKRMKLAAIRSATVNSSLTEQPLYEGLPNAEVLSVTRNPISPDLYNLKLKLADCPHPITRQVGCIAYFVGRRGDLSYLSPPIQAELGISHVARFISGDTLRSRFAANAEVTPGVFAIGSLTGDSLVKFGFGSGAYAAAKILQDVSDVTIGDSTPSSVLSSVTDSPPDVDAAETPSSLPSLASSSSSGSAASGRTDGEEHFSTFVSGYGDQKMSSSSTISVRPTLSISPACRLSEEVCTIS